MRCNSAHFFCETKSGFPLMNLTNYRIYIKGMLYFWGAKSSCTLQSFSINYFFQRPVRSFLWSLCQNKKKYNFFSKGFSLPSGLRHSFLKQLFNGKIHTRITISHHRNWFRFRFNLKRQHFIYNWRQQRISLWIRIRRQRFKASSNTWKPIGKHTQKRQSRFWSNYPFR